MQTVEYSIDEMDFREEHFCELPDFTTKWMPIADFLKTPTISINRGVEKRKKKIGRLLRKEAFIQHLCVIIAEYPNGAKEIVNGNTRKKIWQEDSAPKPDYVFAIIIKYNGKANAKKEYFTIDSIDSVENAKDKFTGAYRELGLTFDSATIKNGTITNTMKDIMSIWPDNNIPKDPKKNPNFYSETVNLFSSELKKLDNIIYENRKNIFAKANAKANIKAVCLMFLKKYGIDNKRLIEGIIKLYTGTFSRGQNRYVDAISHICIELMNGEDSNWIGTATRTNKTNQYNYFIHCFNKWMKDEEMHHPRSYNDENSPYLNFFDNIEITDGFITLNN